MNFDIDKAKRMYHRMFHDSLRDEAINAALQMNPQEFADAQPGCDPDTGEYLDSPFSAGEYDAIESAILP